MCSLSVSVYVSVSVSVSLSRGYGAPPTTSTALFSIYHTYDKVPCRYSTAQSMFVLDTVGGVLLFSPTGPTETEEAIHSPYQATGARETI